MAFESNALPISTIENKDPKIEVWLLFRRIFSPSKPTTASIRTIYATISEWPPYHDSSIQRNKKDLLGWSIFETYSIFLGLGTQLGEILL